MVGVLCVTREVDLKFGISEIARRNASLSAIQEYLKGEPFEEFGGGSVVDIEYVLLYCLFNFKLIVPFQIYNKAKAL